MQKKIVYICDCCGAQSENYSEILKCECSHLGITVQQLEYWKELKKNVFNASYAYSVHHNEETEQALNDAIKIVLAFEDDNGLVEKDVPDLC